MLEVAATMVIIVFILSMTIPNNVQRIQNAQFKKTVVEMKAIAQASIDFYISQGVCPTGISQLVPVYMPQAVTSSPFGSSYQLSCGTNMVSVSDLIPTGLAQKNPEGPLFEATTIGSKDSIMITQRKPYSFIGRLLYDKKHIYAGS